MWPGSVRTWTGAHPRSRGENASVMRLGVGSGGSSPLARGKLQLLLVQARGAGLIPARAGKTSRGLIGARVMRAHPRSRGENVNPPDCVVCHSGSSPLARGKHRQREQVRHRQGLIPARAGKTPSRHQSLGPKPAHPRSRGENGQASAAYFAAQGSSPLARGKRSGRRRRRRPCRLIPARAGKTSRTV